MFCGLEKGTSLIVCFKETGDIRHDNFILAEVRSQRTCLGVGSFIHHHYHARKTTTTLLPRNNPLWHFCACVQLTYCYSRCQNRWSLRQHINLLRCQTYTSTATKLNTIMQNLCEFKARHRNCSQLKADQKYGHCELAPVFYNWGPGLTPGRTNEQTRLSGVIHISHTLSKPAASHHIFTRRAAHTKTVAGFGVFTAQICI